MARLDVGPLRASQALRRASLLADMLPFSARSPDISERPRRSTMDRSAISSASKPSPARTATQRRSTPCLLGMSGAGKSVTVCDLLSQTEGYFAYTVIIEEGLSYGIYTQTVEPNARPIIIHPDGDLTINYLDTKGLPLTPSTISQRDGAGRADDRRQPGRGQADARAGADRQIHQPALRGCRSGLESQTR